MLLEADPTWRSRALRLVNAMLGLWLFISTFVWAHTPAQAVNAALVGVFICLTALSAWSIGPHPRVRLINAALGIWLLTSIGAFPTQSLATRINSAIVGILVVIVALIPAVPARHLRTT